MIFLKNLLEISSPNYSTLLAITNTKEMSDLSCLTKLAFGFSTWVYMENVFIWKMHIWGKRNRGRF